MPTPYGDFRVHAYKSDITGEEHIAMVMGEISEEDEVLVDPDDARTVDMLGTTLREHIEKNIASNGDVAPDDTAPVGPAA